MIFFQEII